MEFTISAENQKYVARIYRHAASFLEYVESIRTLCVLHSQGMRSIIASRDQLALLRSYVSLAGNEMSDEEEKREAYYSELAGTAEAAISEDFPLLNGHSLMGLWGALEAAIEDMACDWLLCISNVAELPVLRGLRVEASSILALDVEARSRFLLREIQRAVGADGRLGVGQFEQLLKSVQLGGPVDETVRKNLLIAQQARHLIAHRGGVVDTRFLSACPDLNLVAGSSLRISSRQLAALRDAMSAYILTIIGRIEFLVSSEGDFEAMLAAAHEVVVPFEKVAAESAEWGGAAE